VQPRKTVYGRPGSLLYALCPASQPANQPTSQPRHARNVVRRGAYLPAFDCPEHHFARKPQFAEGSDDRAIWESNGRLVQVLAVVMGVTAIAVILLEAKAGLHLTLINLLGAGSCGCLASVVVFVLLALPNVAARYEEYRRFERLQNSLPSAIFAVSGAVFALGWIPYVLWRV
jgi:hypothetical protein